MTLQPAPIRVPVLDSTGRPSIEWVRWFNQITQMSGSIPDLSSTTTSLSSLQAALAALQGEVTSLAAAEAALTILTNSNLNGNQQNLNLIAGSGISLSEDSNGNVTITATAPTLTLPQETGETPAGTKDGVNTVFTLANTPAAGTIVKVYRNGLEQDLGRWVWLSGSTLTFFRAPGPNDRLFAIYSY